MQQNPLVGKQIQFSAKTAKQAKTENFKRGLTTLQLLEIGRLAAVNLLTSVDAVALRSNAPLLKPARGIAPNQIPHNYAGDIYTTVTFLQSELNKYLTTKGMKPLAIFLESKVNDPAKSGSKKSLISRLVAQGHFKGSSGNKALRALTPVGLEIERHREFIIDFLQTHHVRTSTQDLGVLVGYLLDSGKYPVKLPAPKNDGSAPANVLLSDTGSALVKAMVTSYSPAKDEYDRIIKAANRSDRLAQAIAAFRKIWTLTKATEPDDVARSGTAGKEFSDATFADALKDVSGFMADSVVNFLSLAIDGKSGASPAAKMFGATVKNALATNPSAYVNATSLSGATNEQLAAAMKATIRNGTEAPEAVAGRAKIQRLFVDSLNVIKQKFGVGATDLDALWAVLGGKKGLNTLLASTGMPKPKGADGQRLKDFSYEAKPRSNHTQETVAVSKRVAGELWNKYLQAQGREARSSGSRSARESRLQRATGVAHVVGFLGPNDKSIVNLSQNRTAVAPALTVLKGILQSKYTKSAMIVGAGLLGVQLPANVMNMNLLKELLVEGILQNNAGNFDNNDPASIILIAAALGVGSTTKNSKTPDGIILLKQSAMNKLEAMYGVVIQSQVMRNGAAFLPVGLTNDDAKNVLKAHQRKAPASATTASLAAALQQLYQADPVTPSATLKGIAQRPERVGTPKPQATSGPASGPKSSGRAKAAPVNLNNVMVSPLRGDAAGQIGGLNLGALAPRAASPPRGTVPVNADGTVTVTLPNGQTVNVPSGSVQQRPSQQQQPFVPQATLGQQIQFQPQQQQIQFQPQQQTQGQLQFAPAGTAPAPTNASISGGAPGAFDLSGVV